MCLVSWVMCLLSLNDFSFLVLKFSPWFLRVKNKVLYKVLRFLEIFCWGSQVSIDIFEAFQHMARQKSRRLGGCGRKGHIGVLGVKWLWRRVLVVSVQRKKVVGVLVVNL